MNENELIKNAIHEVTKIPMDEIESELAAIKERSAGLFTEKACLHNYANSIGVQVSISEHLSVNGYAVLITVMIK